jgi:hypothetical protein
MKVHEIFQGTFKFVSIMGQVLYLSRQAIEHPDHNTVSHSRHVQWAARGRRSNVICMVLSG